MNKSFSPVITATAVFILLSILFIACVNSAMHKRINEGICPLCGYEYEKQEVLSSKKYYICPYCGFEIEKY